MTALIPKMSLEVKSDNGGRYKSIRNVTWTDIPGFSVITGKNGSGKTQLLELIAYSLARFTPQNFTMPDVRILDCGYTADEIGFVPSSGLFSNGTGSSLAEMANTRINAVQAVQNRHDVFYTIKSAKMSKRLNIPIGSRLDAQQANILAETLPDDFNFVIDDLDIIKGISHVFLAYRVKKLEAIDRGTPDLDATGAQIGPPPWEVINDAFRRADFPYYVTSPDNTSLLKRYELKMIDRLSGHSIEAADLSSGEKVLCQLVLWLFTAGKAGVFPKLLLLDEPDAHLHPSMTLQFIGVLKDVLVDKYGVRIMMTSHSPSTVALAPHGSIFEMERGEPAITQVTDRAGIISVLTAGLVTVSAATKYLFVEDTDDVAFYEVIRGILTDHGPSRDRYALKTSPSIVFIPVSVGSGATKLAGGCTIVDKWVQKLDSAWLQKIFFGMRDRDNTTSSLNRIFLIGRYSIENYLLDPLNIYAALLSEGLHPAIPDLEISPGDEHRLRSQSRMTLQTIADSICSTMQLTEPALASASRFPTVYTIGLSIDLPSWVIDYRGHDLLPIAQRAFNNKTITPPKLRTSMQRCRLITKEMADLFGSVQAG